MKRFANPKEVGCGSFRQNPENTRIVSAALGKVPGVLGSALSRADAFKTGHRA